MLRMAFPFPPYGMLIPSSNVSCYKISLSLCSPPHVATRSVLWAFPLDSYSLPCFLIIHPHYKGCRHIHIHQFPGQGEGDLQKQGPSLSGCIISASRRHTQGQFPVSSHLSPSVPTVPVYVQLCLACTFPPLKTFRILLSKLIT